MTSMNTLEADEGETAKCRIDADRADRGEQYPREGQIAK
jgi:hypothetical protein